MRSHSDDEEGFISSDVQIKSKLTSKPTFTIETNKRYSSRFRINYRFAGAFIKKESALVWNTPLTVPCDPAVPASIDKNNHGQKSNSWVHPFQVYCKGNEYKLIYSRTSEEPLLNDKQYTKNEVSLFGIEDKNSPSLKQLKCFEPQPIQARGDDLQFDSRFQNGNLHCAFRKVNTNEYHLFMANDTNTMGYNQWFYFAVQNMKTSTKYTFRVVNYRKKLDFFKQGQRIAMFSMKQAQQKNSGWRRTGTKITFQQSTLSGFPDRKQYVLSFEIEAKHEQDYVLLASSIPYSYSKLIHDLRQLEAEAGKSKLAKWELSSVGTTLCNNQVPEVTITAKESKEDKNKKMIIIMARQHPGEVWSSYVAEGVLKSLLKNTPQNQYLLQNFIIKVYPMVNVDGVIYGNFRCDVTGVDLNRRWKQPSKSLHPQIFDLKKKIQGLTKKWKIELCLDLHGHSKKYNIFCYACKHNSYSCRILPLLIQNESHIFNMPSCTFGLSRDKQTTARATISRIIRSQNVLTVQTSTFGTKNNQTPVHFHPIDLYNFSQQMLKAIRFFLDKKSACFKAAENNVKDNFSKFQAYDHQNLEESGSDSEPQQDQIDFRLKMTSIFDKKYSNEFKSFLRQDTAPPLHLAQIVFHEDNEAQQPSEQSQLLKSKDISTSKYAVKDNANEQIRLERLTYRVPKSKQRYQSTDNHHKKSLSINYSEIGRDLDASRQTIPSELPQPAKVKTKSIMIREKKKLSFINQPSSRQYVSLSPNMSVSEKTSKDEFGRMNLFREHQKEQEKKRIQNFVNRFQKFMPSEFQSKGKGRLQMLQEDLQKDDPLNQLNQMLQNKKRVELQRIKRNIQDTTEVVERQGKMKMLHKKQPIIDFKRFKQNQKAKYELKRLGQFSQRYLEGID